MQAPGILPIELGQHLLGQGLVLFLQRAVGGGVATGIRQFGDAKSLIGMFLELFDRVGVAALNVHRTTNTGWFPNPGQPALTRRLIWLPRRI